MRRVIVLEDAEYRVEWLERHVGDDVHVTHCADVETFTTVLTALETPPNLVILDHDLGTGAPGGEGAAAVPHIPDNADYPVVVWSANPIAGPRMANDLTDRKIEAYYAPFNIDEDYAWFLNHLITVDAG